MLAILDLGNVLFEVDFDDSEENLRGAEAIGIKTVLVDSDSTVEAWVDGLACPPAPLQPRTAVIRSSPPTR